MRVSKAGWVAIGLSLGMARAGGEAQLVIVSPHWEGIRREYTAAFSAWHEQQYGEPVTVEWLDLGGTSAIQRYILSEFSKADSIGIDIFWGGGIDPYLDLAERGVLQPYRLPNDLLAPIPSDYFGLPMYDPQYRWYGTALSGFGISYNKGVLARLGLSPPQTWTDLTRPGFYTWVGSGDPRQSGSTHMIYEIILQAYGWEEGLALLTRLGANIRTFPRSSSQPIKDVARGEIACALAIDIYGLAEIAHAGREVVGFVFPEGQTVINPDAIAILKGAPHQETAERFLCFALSPAGQRLWMLSPGDPEGPRSYLLNRMSVLPALYPELGERVTVPQNPFTVARALPYDPEKGSTRWGLVNDLLGALIIDTHADLQRAWKQIIAAGMPAEALARLVEPPLSEEEALRLARKVWQDQTRRQATISRWVAFAKEKYRDAYRLAGGNYGLAYWWSRTARWAVPLVVLILLLHLGVQAGRSGMRLVKRRFRRQILT